MAARDNRRAPLPLTAGRRYGDRVRRPPGPARWGGRPMTVLDLFRLDGKVAVVTGASSGLGVAAAQALAEAGADVALGARRADRLAETAKLVEATGRNALAVPTDVS